MSTKQKSNLPSFPTGLDIKKLSKNIGQSIQKFKKPEMVKYTPKTKNQKINYVKVFLKNWLFKNKSILTSLVITGLCLWFFAIVIYPGNGLIFGLTQRLIGGLIGLFLLIFTYLICALNKWKYLKFGSTWLRSNILSFFSFAYCLRLNQAFLTKIFLFGQSMDITTSIILLPLAVLIFLVNLNLFGKNQKLTYLIVPQVILYSVHTFSFLNFLQEDRTNLRNFSNDLLGSAFNLNPFIWLIISSLAITLVSVLNLKITNIKKFILFISIYFMLIFQVMVALNFVNLAYFTYWYKTLLVLVFWDYLFGPFYIIATGATDYVYSQKLKNSSLYHIFLVFLIFTFPYIVNWMLGI